MTTKRSIIGDMPKKPIDGEARSTNIQVRVTPSEYKKLNDRRIKEGFGSISDIVRKIILDWLK